MIVRVNPDTLHKNPAFTQVALVKEPATLIYVGGQNAVNTAGEIVGKNDLSSQTEQAIKNMQLALEAVGATLQDLVKMTIYVVQGQHLHEGYAAAGKFPEIRDHPPTISVIVVAGLAHPDYLIEIDAVAAVETGDTL